MSVVTIVSGLPRSGTSMMMKMLEAGGIELLTDGVRRADEDNPKGYYEFEPVKRLRKGDQAWLAEARGKAVKVISELLKWLPQGYEYRVVFMRRNIDEMLASQRSMLARAEKRSTEAEEQKLAALFSKHLQDVEAWLAERPNIDVLYVSYGDLLADPASHLPRIREFLGRSLDIDSMTAVVDPALYRQRS